MYICYYFEENDLYILILFGLDQIDQIDILDRSDRYIRQIRQIRQISIDQIDILDRSDRSDRLAFIILSMDKSMVGDYTIYQTQVIGKGAYSKVYMGASKTGKKVAIKTTKKSKTSTNYTTSKTEASLLKSLKSPHVIELLATFQTQTHHYLVQKYYEGQILSSMLRQRKKLSFGQAEYIFKSVLRGLQYLIAHGVMHRDLKPENILVASSLQTVILDLGLATKFSPKKDEKVMMNYVGSPIYMSPEMLSHGKYNSKSDIWSLGIILYECLIGYPPFKGKSESQILMNIKNNKTTALKQTILPSKYKKLISLCLTIDIQKRINWTELFQWRHTGNLITYDEVSTLDNGCDFNKCQIQ